MKSRRIKKQSTRHIKSVALQKCKKQLSRRRKSIRKGGGPKKSIKASVKAPQGPDIDDVIEEIKKLIKVAEAVPPRDEEISTIVNRLINSVGDVQKRKDSIDAILVNLTSYLNPTQKTALNTKKAELEAELTKKGQDESRLLSEQRAREAETQRKITEREAERKIREAEERKREEEARKKAAEAERKIAAEKKRVEEEKKRVEVKAKKTEIKIISNKPVPSIPTSNVEIMPPPVPITTVDTMPSPAPITTIETMPPPVPPTLNVETIPLDTKTAWIDTGIFSEAELLELKKIFTDQANDAYSSVRSIFRSYSIKEIPQFKDNKSDTESMRNDHNDYISRILLFVGVLIEHIEKHPGIDFQIVIKGGITAQILMSLITNGYYIYQTSDIDLKLLPRGDTPYNKGLLQKHAEDISDLIYFILGSPTNISILKPEQNTINKEIVKMSFNPKKSMFVAMIDIDFKELPEGVKQYYADSVLLTYPTNYGYYKIQNYDAFIKEKLFFKANFQILYLRTYKCKEPSSNDCVLLKMMIDKFRASSEALMSLHGNNTYEYFYRIYKYYFETMNNYYETKPGFIPSTIINMTIPDPNSKYKPTPNIDYEPYKPEKKL